MIAAGVLVALALGAGGFLIVVLANGFSTKDSVDPTIAVSYTHLTLPTIYSV